MLGPGTGVDWGDIERNIKFHLESYWTIRDYDIWGINVTSKLLDVKYIEFVLPKTKE